MDNSTQQNTGIFQLVYVSTATFPLELNELRAIERVAIRNNADLGITSVLTYCESKFMQFLEGEQSNVEEIFSVIKCDSRHHSIDVLRQGMIPKRQFSGWKMKYADIHDIDDSQGYIYNKLFDLKNGENNIFEQAIETLKLLVAFKNSCPSQK